MLLLKWLFDWENINIKAKFFLSNFICLRRRRQHAHIPHIWWMGFIVAEQVPEIWVLGTRKFQCVLMKKFPCSSP